MQIDVRALRRAIAASGQTVASLARDAGISQIVINHWLKGEARPRIDTLGKLARALNVDIYDLLEDEQP